MIDINLNYAVIGASNNQEKYGYKVFNDLLDAGYRVLPVNPKGGEILGQKVYKDILEIKDNVQVAIMIVPPAVGINILAEVLDKKVGMVWFQPGSESEELIKYCRDHKIDYVANACIMLERLK